MFCLYVIENIYEPECCFLSCFIFVFWIVSCVFIFGMDKLVGERAALLAVIERIVKQNSVRGMVVIPAVRGVERCFDDSDACLFCVVVEVF